MALTVYSTPLTDDRAQRRFSRAFETARRLGSHPHTVTMLECGLTLDRRPYVATEIYERGTLDGRVAGRKLLSLDETLRTGIALAGALETAHRADVIHGGVHPARVLVGNDGEPALADLGLVPLIDRGGLAALVGPMSYHAPPEVLEGDPISPATDVYSLASTLYTALTGRPPYRGENEDETVASLLLRILQHAVPPIERPEVPRSLEVLLRQALSCEPKDRPERPLAFARALQGCQQELGRPATEPIVLDIAANLRLASGDGMIGDAQDPLPGFGGFGGDGPASDDLYGAPAPARGPSSGRQGDDRGPGPRPDRRAPSEASAPVQRVFVPYPVPDPTEAEPEPEPAAPAARADDPPILQRAFPEPPPPADPMADRGAPPGTPAPPTALLAPPTDRPAAPASPQPRLSPFAPVAPASRAPGAPVSPVSPARGTDLRSPAPAPAEDRSDGSSLWPDLRLDPPFSPREPEREYDNDTDDDEPDPATASDRQSAEPATSTAPPSPRALPVIVLMGLVAVLVAGVSWMIITGEDPSQEDPDGPSTSSRALEGSGGSGSSGRGDTGPVELTATENAAGVQLDWEESSTGRQLVLVLSVTEAPRALPAETGTALLVPTGGLLPQTGYCFAVVPAEGTPGDAAALAARLPDSALPPSACIRGATSATVRRE